ncbi:MAG: response regulator [Terriglobia bacterium]
MRLLIVDDNPRLAELTAQLLKGADQQARCIKSITLAGDLDTALRLLPQHDVVLCDERVPFSSDSRCNRDEWDEACRKAGRRGTYFVLYSTCPGSTDEALLGDIPAIAKAAAIEEIYTELTKHCLDRWLAAISNQLGH